MSIRSQTDRGEAEKEASLWVNSGAKILTASVDNDHLILILQTPATEIRQLNTNYHAAE